LYIGCVSVGPADNRSAVKVGWLPIGTDTRPADVQLYMMHKEAGESLEMTEHHVQLRQMID
jgi:hypothetical protein